MTDSPKDELEKLQKLRAELENKLAAIDADQKKVEESITVLREKAAVRDLERKVREKQDALAALVFEKNELEEKLKHEPKESWMPEDVPKAKEEIESKEDVLETEKEEKQEPVSEETPEEEESKKKLRFF
ncbi:MAG: hypothetical protein GWN31_06625 [Candidatus Thorarchaeota archaeon]|nr:hypothetical protein [Candidatus Thorarchaeota archaeon]